MTQPCRNTTDPKRLQRDGTSYPQRNLTALAPSSVEIDNQTVADRLVFTKQFASSLKYIGFDNQPVPNQHWDSFFTSDYSATLAIYAVEETDRWQALVREHLNILRGERPDDTVPPPADAQLKQALGVLFGLLGTLAWQIDRLLQQLPDEFPVVPATRSLIQNQLASAFRRLIEYYKAAVDLSLIDETVLPGDKVFGLPVSRFDTILTKPFSNVWIPKESVPPFSTFVASLVPDGTIFKEADVALSVQQRMYFAANHYFLTSIVNQFAKAYGRIVANTQTQFLQTLTQYNQHLPPMTLLLAFLRLLEYAKVDINQLSEGHLNLYYKEILRLSPKPATPVKAHVVAQLAKLVPGYLLKKGTAFKAGKHIDGTDRLFELTDDMVVNQADVTQLKSVYIGTTEDDNADESNPYQFNGRLFAAPVANSIDGLGEPLVAPNDTWSPFAHKQYENEVLKRIVPEGKLGFGMASPYLWLQEGVRTITVTLLADAFPPISNLVEAFSISLTTGKGWKDAGYTATQTTTTLQFVITLPGDFPPSAPHSMKLHGGNADWGAPILAIYLRHQERSYVYPLLRAIRLQTITLQVQVDKVRNLVVQTDAGQVNPAQPFMPFGPQPETGASLIIGSQEVFQKPGASVTTHIEWKPGAIPAATSHPVTVSLLQKGNWSAKLASESIFDGQVAAVVVSPDASLPADYSPTIPYDVTRTSGHLRLTLTDSLGHKEYLEQLSLYLVTLSQGHLAADQIKAKLSTYNSADCDSAKSTVDSVTTIVNNMGPVTRPAEPYTPEILSIYLDYSVTVSLDPNTDEQVQFDQRPLRFLHFYPFGEVEQHRQLAAPQDTSSVSLLPTFSRPNRTDAYFALRRTDGSTPETILHEGEFYIGLQQVDTPSIVSLLIQMEEGSANPLIRKPDQHIHWSFLSQNHWVSFRPDEVVDSTRQLLQSGLIRFRIPTEATMTNTLLPSGLYWLRASVETAGEAVANVIDIQAQGMLVQERSAEGTESTEHTLATNTIQKLAEPVSAIRKIQQPYPGFSGRPRESEADFRVRISERLRHKDRGVTVWDYEHLILEHFPAIYQVKCLPHTHYEPGPSGGVYNELAPGHLTLVALPKGPTETDRRPLKLYTPVGLLDEINEFLRDRISHFAQLHVCNPVYEEVKVEADVKFSAHADESFFTGVLKEEITRFLSPWAYGDVSVLTFNRLIEPSVLINFIEERPYVDYLRNFRLLHRPAKNALFTESANIQPERAVSVLVSVPPAQHTIVPITTQLENALSEHCTCP